MAEVRRERQGIGAALLAALLFGVSAPLAKALLGGTTPQLLAGLLYLGSGLGLLILRSVNFRGHYEAILTRRDVPWLSGAIVVGGVMGPLLLMVGLEHTPASGASLLLNLEGVFTALVAWFVFKENFDRRIAIGMAAIVAGGALLSWEGNAAWGGVWGPLLIAGACAAWAIDNNLTQKVSAGDPAQIAMLKGLIAGSVNIVLAIALGASSPSRLRVVGALVLGFLSYGISLVLFVRALRVLGTARTSAYFSLAPFVGAALSVVLWRDRPSPLFLVAAALMGIGLLLHLSERHEHLHAHEAMGHEHLHVHDAHHQHDHAPGDPSGEPHTHVHQHGRLVHTHVHYPDIHHRHDHG